MIDTVETIQAMLNKPYGAELQGQSRKYVCWKFCRDVYHLLGYPPLKLQHQSGLTRIAEPVVPCIVLFRAVMDWHSGIVWPDGLHFIHAGSQNVFDPDPKEFIVQKARLTAWPWKQFIEGYYCAEEV